MSNKHNRNNYTNYNKPSVEKESDNVAEVKTETAESEAVQPQKIEVKKGVVVNCSRLNVRTNPHPNAAVDLIIEEGTEVEITDSNGEFYHVRKGTTTEGFNGWCMKKYIAVKK